MDDIRFALFSLLATPLLAGCLGRLHTPYDAAAAMPVIAQPLPADSVFAYERRPMAPRQTALVNVRRNYDKILLEFPALDGRGQPPVSLSAHYYRSNQPGARKLVIVLPIWGSYIYPARKVGRTLRRRSRGDIHVIEVLGAERLFFWDEMAAAPTEDAFIQIAGDMAGRVMDTVITIRQLLDWAELQDEVDPNQIGLVGFSMGAIVAAMALGADQRFASGVLMMGAARPGEVFATCNGFPGGVRDAIMERFGWSLERYQSLFEALFAPGDPASFAGRYDPARLLIMDGAFDDCMSKDARRALWEATGRPERVVFLGRHKGAFLSLTPLAFNTAGKKIYTFLNDTLGEKPQLACANGASC
jgi:pimeloyl-ACP methyl ester carboxylesterase